MTPPPRGFGNWETTNCRTYFVGQSNNDLWRKYSLLYNSLCLYSCRMTKWGSDISSPPYVTIQIYKVINKGLFKLIAPFTHYVTQGRDSERFELAKQLIQHHHADVNLRCSRGRTPFEHLCHEECLDPKKRAGMATMPAFTSDQQHELTKLMIDAGLDLNSTDADGRMAFIHYQHHGFIWVNQRLIIFNRCYSKFTVNRCLSTD